MRKLDWVQRLVIIVLSTFALVGSVIAEPPIPGGPAEASKPAEPASSPPTPGCVPASCPRLFPLRLRSPRLPRARRHPSPSAHAGPHRPIPWAELLKRKFQTDVLTCPRWGGTRRVVAVILPSTTAQAILEHLRLPSRPLPLAPATSPPQLGLW
jgi:hypothetical protein